MIVKPNIYRAVERRCVKSNGVPKIRHKTKRAAVAHLRFLRRAYGDQHLSVYRCECRAWHVGHTPASKESR